MIRQALIALALFAAAPAAFAATCSANLEGNDAMQFNLSNIDVSKSCKTFTINLKHTGTMAREVMGHNVVVVKTADLAAVDADGAKAGLANDYIKKSDARVIAHSKVIGGGQTTSVSFPVAKLAAGPHSFFCSYLGHAAIMKGTITLKP